MIDSDRVAHLKLKLIANDVQLTSQDARFLIDTCSAYPSLEHLQQFTFYFVIKYLQQRTADASVLLKLLIDFLALFAPLSQHAHLSQLFAILLTSDDFTPMANTQVWMDALESVSDEISRVQRRFEKTGKLSNNSSILTLSPTSSAASPTTAFPDTTDQQHNSPDFLDSILAPIRRLVGLVRSVTALFQIVPLIRDSLWLTDESQFPIQHAFWTVLKSSYESFLDLYFEEVQRALTVREADKKSSVAFEREAIEERRTAAKLAFLELVHVVSTHLTCWLLSDTTTLPIPDETREPILEFYTFLLASTSDQQTHPIALKNTPLLLDYDLVYRFREGILDQWKSSEPRWDFVCSVLEHQADECDKRLLLGEAVSRISLVSGSQVQAHQPERLHSAAGSLGEVSLANTLGRGSPTGSMVSLPSLSDDEHPMQGVGPDGMPVPPSTRHHPPAAVDVARQEVSLETVSQISQVKDLFPDLGDGYILECLRQYGDVETVIAVLCEPDSLIPYLKKMDKSKPLPSGTQLAQAGPEPLDPSQYDQERRRNRELDQMMNERSNVYSWSHQPDDAQVLEPLDQRAKQQDAPLPGSYLDKKSGIGDYVTYKERILDMQYEDEYDDTWDDVLGMTIDALATVENDPGVNEDLTENFDETEGGDIDGSSQEKLTVQAAVDPIRAHLKFLVATYANTPSVFDTSAETRRSKARQALKDHTGLDDHQLEGWRVMFERDPRKDRVLEDVMLMGGRHLNQGSGQASSDRGRGGGTSRGRGRGRGGGRGRGKSRQAGRDKKMRSMP